VVLEALYPVPISLHLENGVARNPLRFHTTTVNGNLTPLCGQRFALFFDTHFSQVTKYLTQENNNLLDFSCREEVFSQPLLVCRL